MTNGERVVRHVVDNMGITRADIKRIERDVVVTHNHRRIPHGLKINSTDWNEWIPEINEAIRSR